MPAKIPMEHLQILNFESSDKIEIKLARIMDDKVSFKELTKQTTRVYCKFMKFDILV